MPIRHAEPAAGLRDRPGLLDRLKEADFARSQRAAAAQVNTQCQLWRFHDEFRTCSSVPRARCSRRSEHWTLLTQSSSERRM